ncbi:MAG TPA: TonB family protein [Gemmatimonadales bacterium]|nr:TonB family protein [Gemmatimonadales bacterium]
MLRFVVPAAAIGLALSARMAASQTAADRIAAARAEIRSRNLDSARALLRQLVDSPSAADRSDRAVAFLWLGIISFYEGDDSASARSFRASLTLNALLSGDDLVRVDSTLASVWKREQADAWRRTSVDQPAAERGPVAVRSMGRVAVHDCVRACKAGEQPPRLIDLPQMRIDADRGQLGPSGVHGRVVVRAVIDEGGRLEPASISLVTSSSSAFERAVREVLPQLRFRPAQAGSQPVPALIELRFDIRPEGLDWVRYEVSTP